MRLQGFLAVMFLGLMSSGANAEKKGDGWHFFPGDEPGLSFGQSESDDLIIGFSCNKGYGAVTVTTNGVELRPGATVTVVLSVGKVRTVLSGAAEDSAVHGGQMVTAMIGIGDRLFRALSRPGKRRLVIGMDDGEETVSLKTLGAKGREFIEACKPAPRSERK